MVIPEDDIGLIVFCACASYCIVRTDDIIVLTIFQCGIEPFHIVQLRGFIFIIGIAAASNRVAHAGDLGHIGFFHTVTAAHDHDLTTAVGNSSSHFFINVSTFKQRLCINISVRVLYCVAGAQDDGRIGICGHIRLADKAVGYTAIRFCCIRIPVDIDRTKG